MDAKTRILIVDDEKTDRESLTIILVGAGYEVIAVESAEAALNELARQRFDLMILDIKLTGPRGIQALEATLQQYTDLGIIVLTSQASLETAIQAVRYHLSDYLLKPFTADEILDSVRRALPPPLPDAKSFIRENSSTYSANLGKNTISSVRISGTEVDFGKRRITWENGTILLTPTEGRLIQALYEHQNQVIRHSELVMMVHGYQVGKEEAARILRPVMSRLRRKLSAIPGGDRWIQNVRGSGYLLEID